ncbi:DUF1963 domain-containing protein [Actinomadura kijaniata]|uniref:DUF1963 domain-containing protein n=1 Tax=Actinomadura kijaniata TaxID=46161 RepID=UPI00082EC23C|nr:DUF1963 domain-containing protein [Actinomadura kijaniata]
MDLESALAASRMLCTEHLGERLGRQLAELARPGFGLWPATAGRAATGRCRLGGPALLEPGVAWPEVDGLALSLFAVLDMDELASWAGDQAPVRAGVLNFFYLDLPHRFELSDRRICTVVAADPTRALEVAPPEPLTQLEVVSLHARGGVSVPSPYAEYSRLVWERLEPDDEVCEEFECDPSGFVAERFGEAWLQDPGRLRADAQAFGWPLMETSALKARPEDGDRHLLTLSSNHGSWSFPNGGSLMFFIPKPALREGDLSQVFTEPDAW